MAALDDVPRPAGVNDATAHVLKGAVAAHFWNWYVAHAEDQIVRLKVLFFTVTVRVKTVRPLFVALLGEPSYSGVTA